MKWLWEQYLNGPVDRTNPYAVPHSAKSYEGLAPAVMFTAEYDVLRQDGIDYAAKLKAAGVPTAYIDCPGMIHGFFNYGKYIDEANRLYIKGDFEGAFTQINHYFFVTEDGEKEDKKYWTDLNRTLDNYITKNNVPVLPSSRLM